MKRNITGKDILFLYLLILIIPIIYMVFLPYFFNKITNLISVYLALLTILIIITFINILLKKPYIAITFSCHQDKNKSFNFIYKYLGICARCAGIYLGIFFSIILILLASPWYVYFLIGIPLIIDGITQYKGFRNSNNFIRLLTGFLFGPTLVYILYLFHYCLYQIAYYFYSLL
ncbi:MAG: DUF2085 domain-containing protein [Bacillota bacterium]